MPLLGGCLASLAHCHPVNAQFGNLSDWTSGMDHLWQMRWITSLVPPASPPPCSPPCFPQSLWTREWSLCFTWDTPPHSVKLMQIKTSLRAQISPVRQAITPAFETICWRSVCKLVTALKEAAPACVLLAQIHGLSFPCRGTHPAGSVSQSWGQVAWGWAWPGGAAVGGWMAGGREKPACPLSASDGVPGSWSLFGSSVHSLTEPWA